MIAIFEKDYTRDLISLVNDKRKQSIAEYTLTDLNYKSISEIHLWYENIIELINKCSSKNYVKSIVVQEKEELVESISYKYTNLPSNTVSITILDYCKL